MPADGAARRRSQSGMRAGELDLKARTWTLPASRSKNKHAHTVPLSDAAIGVIEEALADACDDRLFPRRCRQGGSGADAVGRTIRVAQERFGIAPWTAHDLRRTAVTGMAKLGVSPIVLGHVINHRSVTKAGVTLAVYPQYDYARRSARRSSFGPTGLQQSSARRGQCVALCGANADAGQATRWRRSGYLDNRGDRARSSWRDARSGL